MTAKPISIATVTAPDHRLLGDTREERAEESFDLRVPAETDMRDPKSVGENIGVQPVRDDPVAALDDADEIAWAQRARR